MWAALLVRCTACSLWVCCIGCCSATCCFCVLHGLFACALRYRVFLCGLLMECIVCCSCALHSSFAYCRVLFCGLLFLCANVLKKLLAKLFSSHFYKATHYDKMQDALRKEFFIVALSQPREDREEDDPMKHKPSTLAELRTKSFAAGGALVRPLTCLVVTWSQCNQRREEFNVTPYLW